MSRRLIPSLIICLVWGAANASASYVYDFPGTPGSGLATDQSNPQPGNATFGDWQRVGVVAAPTANVFDSAQWQNTSVFDPTSSYVSFDITATSGYHLDLSGSITFDQMRSAGGPTKGRIRIFLNGSATAYATFNWNPTPSLQGQSFNFTPTTDVDNVTSVEVRFYGWNGGDPLGSMLFDNVAVGITAIVPEPATWLSALIPLSLIVASSLKWRRSRGRVEAK